jgi:hypothetical protein
MGESIMLNCAAMLLAGTMVVGQGGATGDEYLAFWTKYFQGEWTTKIVEGEETGTEKTGTEGTWTCTLGPTKACMLFLGTSEGKPQSNAVAGYDPKSKSWKEIFFFADGSHLIQSYRARTGYLNGDPVGKTVKGRAQLFFPDGKVERSAIHVEVIGPDTCEYVVTERRVDGEERPHLKWVFERKKQ